MGTFSSGCESTFPSTFSQLNKVQKNPISSEKVMQGRVVVVQGYLPLSKKTPEKQQGKADN